MKDDPRIGSSLEDSFDEDGRLDGATDTAIKRVLAWQLEQAMTNQRISKAEMKEMLA